MASNDEPSPFQFVKINNATSSVFSSGETILKDIDLSITCQSGAEVPQFANVIAATKKFEAGNITSHQTFGDSTSTLETDHTNKKAAGYYAMGDKHDPDKKRGRCVILGYKYFYKFNPITNQWSGSESETRPGNDFDVGALYATFGGLNFEVVTYLNLFTQQTKDALEKESQLNHSNYDCFVLCILSHGQCEKFQCSDLGEIEYKYVFDLFEGDSLKDKPKLFFIEACLGGANNHGQDSSAQPNAPPLSTNPVDINQNTLRFLPNNLFTKSLKADMFAFYATYPGFISLSHPLKGSWFTQALCQVLNQFADKEDLSKMAQKVNDKVSKEVCLQVAQMQPVKQMSHYLGTLTKEVKFY